MPAKIYYELARSSGIVIFDWGPRQLSKSIPRSIWRRRGWEGEGVEVRNRVFSLQGTLAFSECSLFFYSKNSEFSLFFTVFP